MRFCLLSLYPKLFPCRTLSLGIQNVVDKLSFVKSPRSLRRSFKIFPVLCPILIGPLFHHRFHTNDELDFLSAHGHGPVRPVKPRLLFLSPSEVYIVIHDDARGLVASNRRVLDQMKLVQKTYGCTHTSNGRRILV